MVNSCARRRTCWHGQFVRLPRMATSTIRENLDSVDDWLSIIRFDEFLLGRPLGLNLKSRVGQRLNYCFIRFVDYSAGPCYRHSAHSGHHFHAAAIIRRFFAARYHFSFDFRPTLVVMRIAWLGQLAQTSKSMMVRARITITRTNVRVSCENARGLAKYFGIFTVHLDVLSGDRRLFRAMPFEGAYLSVPLIFCE